jgi:hypothetical protein
VQQPTAEPRNIALTFATSLIVAGLALVIFVLPAEYGVDPIGVGEALGINGMSGYSVSALSTEEDGYAEDYIEFALAPFESIEYKYGLNAGQAMVYSWSTEAEVIFDFHSEEVGTEPEDSVSWSIGRGQAEHGTYVAPFSGIHGWFWENRGSDDVVVRLKTTGYFSESTTYSRSGEYKRTF